MCQPALATLSGPSKQPNLLVRSSVTQRRLCETVFVSPVYACLGPRWVHAPGPCGGETGSLLRLLRPRGPDRDHRQGNEAVSGLGRPPQGVRVREGLPIGLGREVTRRRVPEWSGPRPGREETW